MKWAIVPRLVALLAVVLAGFYYIGVDVLGWQLGSSGYQVSVDLPRAGGLYTGGDVDYRGVPVGKVSALRVSQSGVVAVLAINQGVRIPAAVRARVRQLSALGEQYMDLVPTSSSGPDLHGGSVIAASDATVPVAVGTALADASSLLKGINPNDIQTIESVLSSGFAGTNGDLKTIVDTGQSLANALVSAAPATVQLVVDGQTVLDAALATNTDWGQFTHSLDQLTGTFRSSGADIQALLANGVAAESQLNPFLQRTGGAVESLVHDAGSAGQVSLAYQPAVQALFSVLPVVAADIGSVGANGQVRAEISINTQNTVCSYIPGAEQAPPTQPTGAPTLGRQCPFTAPDLLQRGSQYAPVAP